MYQCPKCKKTYKKNGKWLMKHMIESCHVQYLKPIKLTDQDSIEEIAHLVLKLLKSKGITINGIERLKIPGTSEDLINPEEQKRIIVINEMKAIFSKIEGKFDYHQILTPITI
ncbi:MAG: hypothetical protein ACFFCV_20180 [Promethearchaeota archaeon]